MISHITIRNGYGVINHSQLVSRYVIMADKIVSHIFRLANDQVGIFIKSAQQPMIQFWKWRMLGIDAYNTGFPGHQFHLFWKNPFKDG